MTRLSGPPVDIYSTSFRDRIPRMQDHPTICCFFLLLFVYCTLHLLFSSPVLLSLFPLRRETYHRVLVSSLLRTSPPSPSRTVRLLDVHVFGTEPLSQPSMLWFLRSSRSYLSCSFSHRPPLPEQHVSRGSGRWSKNPLEST